VVVRIGKDGNLKNSRPCNHCLETMIKYKIKKITYSTEDGIIVSEKPQDMEKNHISSGWKSFSKLVNLR
jgi:deoxycytidylate deaminase